MYIYLSVDIMLLEAITILFDSGIESMQRRTAAHILRDRNRGYCSSCRYIGQNNLIVSWKHKLHSLKVKDIALALQPSPSDILEETYDQREMTKLFLLYIVNI